MYYFQAINGVIHTVKGANMAGRECKWYPVCPMKRYLDKGKLDEYWVEHYCRGDWSSCVRYRMEEEGVYHPDWMLPDGSIDESLRNS